VPVGIHLADQLLLPLALAGQGCFTTVAPSRHATTNIATIKQFLNSSLQINRDAENRWLVSF
jgi:RNA 3'-terminal phosphate cyclase (ATP)